MIKIAVAAFFIAGSLLVAGCGDQAQGASVATPSATNTPASQPTATSAPAPTTAPAASGEKLRYAAIGASDTVGLGTIDQAHDNWASQLAAMLPAGTEFQRFARSGITLGEAMTSEIPSAIEYQPNVITMWLVVNDALSGVQPAQYRTELRQTLDRLLNETSATILLLNTPDLSGILPDGAKDTARLQLRGIAAGWNKVIDEAIAGYSDRVVLVDLFGPSQDTLTNRDWISPDGFHPSVTGYHVLAGVVLDSMRAAHIVP